MLANIDRFEEVRKKVKEVAARANELYGVDLSTAAVSFNLRGRVAGWAGCKICAGQRNVYFRFNCELISGKHFEDILNETVPHELAHGVCFVRPELGRKHDAGWKRVCVALGGNGKTRHDYDVVVKGRWDYVTDLGHKVSVTTRLHNHVQAGGVLRFKRGKGTIDRYSRFAPSGQEMPAVSGNGARPTTPVTTWRMTPPVRRLEPAPIVQQPVTLDRMRRAAAGVSKAEQVRMWIRDAKASGRDSRWVIAIAQNELGMARSMASKYVTENWERA